MLKFSITSAKQFAMSLWISRAIILLFLGALLPTAFFTLSFSSAKSCTNSRKFPLFVDSSVSSWPRKAKTWCNKYRTSLMNVFNRIKWFSLVILLCLFMASPIDWPGFNKLSHLFTAVLWKLLHLLPTWSLSLSDLLYPSHPSITNASFPP